MVMLMTAVLAGVAASLLLITSNRYQTSFQSASWQEAIIGAESGVDLGMNELRKRVTQGPSASFQLNWTTATAAGKAFPNYGHAFPSSGGHPYTLATHLGEGNTTVQARVFVDVPGASTSPLSNFAIPPADAVASYLSQLDNPNLQDPDGVDRSNWWYRIRSLGVSGVSGPTRPGIDRRDNQMRRLSFFTDWRTGQAVSSPQTARLVQALVKPVTGFRNALMADQWINLNDQNVLIDSYDSSKGIYSASSNHGNQGNIATNGQLINANHAQVDGGASTNDGSVKNADKVTGQQSSNFYQELTPYTNGMLNPAWSATPNGGTLVSDATYVGLHRPGQPDARAPKRHRPARRRAHDPHRGPADTARRARAARAQGLAAGHDRHDDLVPQGVHRRRHGDQRHQRHRGGQRSQRDHLPHRQRQPER